MRKFQYLAAGLLLAFFVFFLVVPLTVVVGEGASLTVLREIWLHPLYRAGMLNSLALAAATTGIVFLIAMPLALAYDRYSFPGKDLLHLLLLCPLILPPFVGAIGFQQVLGHNGVLNTLIAHCGGRPVDFLAGGDWPFLTVAVCEALHLYPVLYLNLLSSLANLDPAFDEAARNLGLSRARRFFFITLPLVKPGLLAGGTLVLIWSFTELGTPLMFGFNRVLPVQIFNGLTELESNPVPYGLVLVMLAASALLYALARL
ncbi:MAG: ABC transporter permease subunit, partial [Planctomycetes bacterium]|nr:ABC transporter permease subunit [Planctomycetota bacterium]